MNERNIPQQDEDWRYQHQDDRQLQEEIKSDWGWLYHDALWKQRNKARKQRNKQGKR